VDRDDERLAGAQTGAPTVVVTLVLDVLERRP
jgi:hypothetical protein